MKKDMFTVDEVKELINKGERLILAADERLLRQLPPGQWIAGTIPYFMSSTGGLCTDEKIFVNFVPEYVTNVNIREYSKDNVRNVYNDAPDNGFSIIIIPALSEIYLSFQVNAWTYENFATRPLAGWVSGQSAENYGNVPAKVYNGLTASELDNSAVVLHADLPDNKRAEIDFINIFRPGDGATIEFLEDGLSAKEVLINGQKANFAEYMLKNQVDIKLPIVGDMFGAMINRSLKEIDEENQQVLFYAPIFKGVKFKLAAPITDYMETFNNQISNQIKEEVFFSCNCFLNYVYAEMEGKITKGVAGPIAFGEIAYQYLNQTLVYLVIHDVNE